MKTGLSRIYTVLAAVIVSSLITACGGGGGGSTVAGGTTTPPPTATVSSYFPTQGKTGVLKTINPVVVLNVANATSGDANAVVWKCGSTTINAVATAPISSNPDGSTSMILTFAPKMTTDSANIHGSDYCTLNGDVSVFGAGGTVKVSVSMSFYIAPDVIPTCPAPQTYDTVLKACKYPMNANVLGTSFNQVPAGCTAVATQCWKDFVMANKAIVMDSSVKQTGAPLWADRMVNFIGLITPTSHYQILMVYSDTGELINPSADIDATYINGGIDYVVSNELGYIFKHTTTGVCYQWHWNPPSSTGSSNVWNNTAVTCPM